MTPRALDGLTVLDLATFIAAPFCATLLGEFGADVIKVEQPGIGDDLRRLGRKPAPGVSWMWLVESRNKKSITCNLREPEGQALIRRLAERADVVCENFRPGTLERWNLGWADLSRVNPALVMVRVSGFGQTGPYRERPGFGRIAGAVSGASYLAGEPDRPPVPPGTPTIPDYLAGVLGAFGALVALQHRQRTGEGQVVDLALYEPMLRMLDELVPVYAATGHVRERIGAGTEYVVPHSHYRTRDERFIAIACTNDRMFERLATAMERPELTMDFRTVAERLPRREELDGLVGAWTGKLDAADALARLESAGVPSALVASVRDLFADPQLRARENIVAMPAVPPGGTSDAALRDMLLHMVGVVPKLSATPGRIEAPGPLEVGAHNNEIYCGRLGLTRDDLLGLRERGVI